MQNNKVLKRPTREELIKTKNTFKDKLYKQPLIIDKMLPITLKAGDYLLSANKNHHPLDVGYTPEAIKEIKIVFKKTRGEGVFAITANSGIILVCKDIELKEDWFNAE